MILVLKTLNLCYNLYAEIGVSKEKIKVIHKGISLNSKKQIPDKVHDVFQIISIGKSHWEKGYNYALDACLILKKQDVQFHYTIYGGVNDIELSFQVHDLGLANEVSLLKTLPNAKAEGILNRADLLLVPSIAEDVDNLVLQAMSNRTLVVTTVFGTTNNLIKDGENGFLINARNPEDIAKNIIKIRALQNDEKTTILDNAKHTIETTYSVQQMVE